MRRTNAVECAWSRGKEIGETLVWQQEKQNGTNAMNVRLNARTFGCYFIMSLLVYAEWVSVCFATVVVFSGCFGGCCYTNNDQQLLSLSLSLSSALSLMQKFIHLILIVYKWRVKLFVMHSRYSGFHISLLHTVYVYNVLMYSAYRMGIEEKSNILATKYEICVCIWYGYCTGISMQINWLFVCNVRRFAFGRLMLDASLPWNIRFQI